MKFKKGERVIDTHINQMATIVNGGYGGLYSITYDEPPPVEYNMGSLKGLQFENKLKRIKP